MNAVLEAIESAGSELLGRATGPMHVRLFLQPAVASVLAVRAGLRDARGGQPPFLWTIFTDPASRQRLVKSGWKDIGKVFLLALALDAIYQAIDLHTFHPVQALLVAVVLALVPYSLVRGLVTRLARRAGPDAGPDA